MSSKINLQTCEYACKSSIFQDNQLIYYKRIAEDTAYNMLKNDLGFDDDAIAWIRADLEKILSKADSEDKKNE